MGLAAMYVAVGAMNSWDDNRLTEAYRAKQYSECARCFGWCDRKYDMLGKIPSLEMANKI